MCKRTPVGGHVAARGQSPCEPLRRAARRKRVAARGHGGRPRSNCVAMDVGADEFEQSLPLLQELVLGADFVGKAGGSGLCGCMTLAGASLRREGEGGLDGVER